MAKRNVLIIAHGFPPTSGAGVHRPLRFAKYLPEFGWRPIVVSARCEGRLANRRDDALLSQIPDQAVVIRTKGLDAVRPTY